MIDAIQRAQAAFERTARNMVDGPLSMFYYDHREFGRVYVAVGRQHRIVEILDHQMRRMEQLPIPWCGIWFVMINEKPIGQKINALPAEWSESEIMADVLDHIQDPVRRFRA